jgi:hypothetical protein
VEADRLLRWHYENTAEFHSKCFSDLFTLSKLINSSYFHLRNPNLLIGFGSFPASTHRATVLLEMPPNSCRTCFFVMKVGSMLPICQIDRRTYIATKAHESSAVETVP